MVTDDPYALLGVADDADEAAIRRAYRARALACHPDVNPDDPRAVERFLALGQAFALLADPLRRAAYDRSRGVVAPVVRAEVPDAPVAPRKGDALFVAAPSRRPRRGADVRWTLDIPDRLAREGGRLHLGNAPAAACPSCRGSGTRLAACWVCDGRGSIPEPFGPVTLSRTCPACAGRGVDHAPCTACRGTGRAFGPGIAAVTVPAATVTGDVIVVPGAGEPGQGGGPAGDLLLAARVLDPDGRD
ncbi:DnaJ domain-containing protein [Solidesulfovibrio sp.]|uniref:DnaJ domain-containing protein n=1 Tax=Solidesulfovibrio sp. TaxID=2910990 RepID=UPI002621DFF2|nr:DnaJ domain-containing protein [Solidesulfovibrio sp.]